MRYILVLVLVTTVFVGCNNVSSAQNNDLQPVSSQKTVHKKQIQNRNMESEAIVVFKKGTAIQTAKEIIDDYGMYVLKVYKGISVSNNMPMLHVKASLPMQEMLQILRKDPRVSSVSPDYVRHLDNR